jgi:hypothetical protein
MDMEEQKDVAYYSALINAWITSKMERDKTLVLMSGGGIGLLVTLLSTVGAKQCWKVILYSFAFIFFTLTIVICIIIFDKNSKHIEEVLNKGQTRDYALRRLDKWSLISFVLAMLFSISIGVVSALNN